MKGMQEQIEAISSSEYWSRITEATNPTILFCLSGKLKRIDLTANQIRSIDDDAFLGLPELEELVIRENHVSQLPGLPNTMTLIDGSHNDIGSKGIHHEAFKVRTTNLTHPFRLKQYCKVKQALACFQKSN